MIGFIYETTNLVTGKKYIGKRQTNWEGWEDYLGSSKLLKKDIEKYGRENFERKILDTADCKTELAKLEIKHLLENNVAKSDDYYNQAIPRLSWADGWHQRPKQSREWIEKRASAVRGKKRKPYNVKVKYRGTPEMAKKILDLHEQGLTPWQIHLKLNYNANSIKNYLKDQGLTPNMVKTWQNKWTAEQEEEVLELYRSGKSCKDIAKITKRNKTYIIAMVKKHGIELRDGNHYKRLQQDD